PREIAGVGELDLDDLGAQERELIGTERPRQHIGEIEDADAVEKATHAGYSTRMSAARTPRRSSEGALPSHTRRHPASMLCCVVAILNGLRSGWHPATVMACPASPARLDTTAQRLAKRDASTTSAGVPVLAGTWNPGVRRLAVWIPGSRKGAPRNDQPVTLLGGRRPHHLCSQPYTAFRSPIHRRTSFALQET